MEDAKEDISEENRVAEKIYCFYSLDPQEIDNIFSGLKQGQGFKG